MYPSLNDQEHQWSLKSGKEIVSPTADIAIVSDLPIDKDKESFHKPLFSKSNLSSNFIDIKSHWISLS